MTTLIRPSAPIIIKRSTTVIGIEPVAVTRVIPVPVAAITVAPIRPATVRPPERGAWDERGWTRRIDGRSEVYEGQYQVGTQRFRGRVEVARRGKISAFVHNPPVEIRRHRHSACFQQIGTGTGWFLLHWRRSPRNVDEAILYFEQVLDESINR